MYEATEDEQIILMDSYGYNLDEIKLLDSESEKVRQGIPIMDICALLVSDYQTKLHSIRRSQKKWWQFWR